MEIGFLTLILILVLTILCLYIKRQFSYWKDRNVVELEPILFYGNFKRVLKGEVPVTDVVSEIYNKVKTKGEKFGGFYALFSPLFVPVDLDLIKCIYQNDFSHFMNRGIYVHEEKEPLTAHLAALNDEKWRNLRAKVTPTFTTGKIKIIFQTLTSCSIGLEKLLKVASTSKNGIDIKDIVSRYTTDVIGSIGFGLDVNTMENADSEFRRFGLEQFDPTTTENKTLVMLNYLPKRFAKLLNLRTLRKEVATYFINLIEDTVAYREKNNIYRKDFLHLLIQLKNFGEVGDNEDRRVVSDNKNTVQGLTMQELAAQCYVFFIAGFETSSSTITYALLELAQRQDIQDKVREEINKVLEKYNNEMTYEAIAEMHYLDKTVLEALRKHPPVPMLRRICTKKYHVPNSDLVLDVGTKVNIPACAIQRDPDYYPDPDKFEPERFNEENKAKRHPMAFMPFGGGPRSCIGYRLGKVQSKVGLSCILKNYKVTLHEKTQLPIKYEMTLSTSVKGGVWINLEPLN